VPPPLRLIQDALSEARLVTVVAVLFALAQIGFAAAVLLAPPRGAAP
jgi:hypothetical protein